MTQRLRFRGQIAGVGSTSGVRAVVGRWSDTHLGSFGDAMVETREGHRVLIAPSHDVAEFICATYDFDEVRVGPVTVEYQPRRWHVESASLDLTITVGSLMLLGRLLRLVPPRLAASPAWSTVVDPIARSVMRGVRTRGTALAGRQEFYGATDPHAVTDLVGHFDGQTLGALAPVDPPCRFGSRRPPAGRV